MNSALLSRCQVYVLESAYRKQPRVYCRKRSKRWAAYKEKKIELKKTALIQYIRRRARKLLNLLKLVADVLGNNAVITDDAVMEIAQQRVALYDKKGETSITISFSAFIKYAWQRSQCGFTGWQEWLKGEDVKFIARRMLIFASEDIGCLNPNALLLATSTFQAVNMIDLSWKQSSLSNAPIYLASSVKAMLLTGSNRWNHECCG